MTDNAPETFQFTPENEQRFLALLPRYPTREAAMIPALWIVQEQETWLPPAGIQHVADRLDLPLSKILGVATFYTMFKLEKGATWNIQVCQTVCCWLRGSEKFISHAEKKLGIKAGETTPDGKFSLHRVECLACCHTAPVVQVNKLDFNESMTIETFDKLIDSLK